MGGCSHTCNRGHRKHGGGLDQTPTQIVKKKPIKNKKRMNDMSKTISDKIIYHSCKKSFVC